MSQQKKLTEKQRTERNNRLFRKRSAYESQKDLREIDKMYSLESLLDD